MSPRLRTEDGDTLIELIISVAILGLAVVAILGSIAAGIITSQVHRRQANANTLLVSAAESIKNPLLNPHKPCAVASDYNPVNGVSLGTWNSSTVAITAIAYWNGSAWDTLAHCQDTSNPDGTEEFGDTEHLQRIDLKVTSPDSRTSLSMSVIKGNS